MAGMIIRIERVTLALRNSHRVLRKQSEKLTKLAEDARGADADPEHSTNAHHT